MRPTSREFASRNKTIIACVLLGIFLFYWFQLRPIRINQICSAQAGASARELLLSKRDVATDPERVSAYQELIDKNMYLRSDYESYYTRCLHGYGIFI